MSFTSNVKRALRLPSERTNFSLLLKIEFLTELKLYFPVSVLVFEKVTGSFTLAMAIFSIINITQALAELPTGTFSDRFGRKKTLIISAALELLGTFMLALACVTTAGTTTIFAAAVCFGIAAAFYSGNNHAMIYESLPSNQQADIAHRLSRLDAATQASLALTGLLAGGLLWLGLGYTSLVILSLIPVSLALILSFMTAEPKTHSRDEGAMLGDIQKALRIIQKNPRLLGLAIASIWKNGLGNSMNSFAPGFIDTVWPVWAVAFYRMGQNGVGFVSAWFAGVITQKWGASATLLWGNMISIITALIAYTWASVASPILLLVNQVCYIFTRTADNTLQQENFSNAQRATLGSIISLGTALGSTVAGLFLGLIADTWGASIALISGIILRIPILIIYTRLYKNKSL